MQTIQEAAPIIQEWWWYQQHSHQQCWWKPKACTLLAKEVIFNPFAKAAWEEGRGWRLLGTIDYWIGFLVASNIKEVTTVPSPSRFGLILAFLFAQYVVGSFPCRSRCIQQWFCPVCIMYSTNIYMHSSFYTLKSTCCPTIHQCKYSLSFIA